MSATPQLHNLEGRIEYRTADSLARRQLIKNVVAKMQALLHDDIFQVGASYVRSTDEFTIRRNFAYLQTPTVGLDQTATEHSLQLRYSRPSASTYERYTAITSWLVLAPSQVKSPRVDTTYTIDIYPEAPAQTYIDGRYWLPPVDEDGGIMTTYDLMHLNRDLIGTQEAYAPSAEN